MCLLLWCLYAVMMRKADVVAKVAGRGCGVSFAGALGALSLCLEVWVFVG